LETAEFRAPFINEPCGRHYFCSSLAGDPVKRGAAREELIGMQRGVNSIVFAAFLAGLGLAGPPSKAAAATHDGNWSVLIITEKGTCDRGYRYAVNVANGHVRYAGDGSVNLSGTVTPTGLVKVSIRLGDKGASGSGHLRGQSGAGIWHGIGGSGSCSGRWEAERR